MFNQMRDRSAVKSCETQIEKPRPKNRKRKTSERKNDRQWGEVGKLQDVGLRLKWATITEPCTMRK